MIKPKKCGYCGIFYVGEGYQGCCIKECYFRSERASKREKKINKPVKKYDFHEPYVEPKNPIKEKNSHWATKQPRKKMTKEQIKKRQTKVNIDQVYKPLWTGKQYKAVRG